ncbi:MAG: SEC-C metal-binding domain-containing protein [Nitrospirota bacterium]
MRPAAFPVTGRNKPTKPAVNSAPKIGRNNPCSCGSGKKFKKCFGKAHGGCGPA